MEGNTLGAKLHAAVNDDAGHIVNDDLPDESSKHIADVLTVNKKIDLVTDEELALLTAEREVTGESVGDQSQRTFQDAAPLAARELARIARFGTSERNRIVASTYIIDRVLGRVQDNPPQAVDNPYNQLIAEIQKFANDHPVRNED